MAETAVTAQSVRTETAQRLAREARRFKVAAALTAVVLLVLAGILVSGVPHEAKRIISNVAFPVASGVAALMWLTAVRNPRTRNRTATLFLGTTACWAVGNVFWCYYQLVADAQPFPGLNDPFYIAALLFGIAALMTIRAPQAYGRDRLRTLLDGVVVGGSVLFISAALALGQIFSAASGTLLARVVFVTYPIGDVVLITLALLLMARADRSRRLQLGLVMSGMVAYAAADTQYTGNAASDSFAVGSLLDLGWIGGYLLVGLAALAPTHARAAGSTSTATVSSVVRSVVVYLPLSLAVIVAAAVGRIGLDQPVLVVDGLLVLVAVGLRQVLLAVDDSMLRRGLEATVQERTRDLSALARRSDAILHAVGDGLYGIDADGLITFVNPAAQVLLGRSDDELVGRHGHGTIHHRRLDGSANPWTDCPVHRAVTTGETVTSEEEYVLPDDSHLAIELTASAVVEDGVITGAVVAFRDIRKRREVDRMKDEFISVVSHELRTPLTSIRGSLGLVSSGKLGTLEPKAARMLAVAAESTDRLTRLINDILDIERIESGTMPMERESIDVRELIGSAVRELQPAAQAAGVDLVWHAEEGYVNADSDRIVQTITNLVSNAVKFSATGDAVVVRTVCVGDEVVVSITDQGRGIPADNLESIFGRFQQVDSSDARQKGGTGLGLAISKGIVEGHGGRIWVESTPGVGSVFHFALPALARGRSLTESRGAPAVLVCDDDPDMLAVVEGILGTAGFRTVTCSGGTEAFRIAVKQRPAVILLDLNMPLPDGRDAFRNLLLHPATSDVPVIVLSSVPPEEEPAIAARAAGWLTKPVEAAVMVRMVSAAVRRRPQPVVLVVEDDEPLVDVLAATLERRGFVVASAGTATDAVNLSKRLLPDVLLLDLTLLEGDGFEIVAALRADPRLAVLPLIVYTGRDLDAAAREQLTLGQTVFLTKTRVGPYEVEERVAELLADMPSQDNTGHDNSSQDNRQGDSHDAEPTSAHR